MNVDVIIPALNEAENITGVVTSIPRPPVRTVIVADNGSTDGTGRLAEEAGARVVAQPERGYGAACLAAMEVVERDCDIVVFLDGDGSDDPGMLPDLIEPILDGRADFVVGSRALGQPEPGAISPQQVVGNAIAARWLSARFGLPATDLGPFRAVRWNVLQSLDMRDRNYGWTVEMQVKAAKRGVPYAEIPVPYFRRGGRSKVSGTLRGVFGASYKILGLLAYHDVLQSWRDE